MNIIELDQKEVSVVAGASLVFITTGLIGGMGMLIGGFSSWVSKGGMPASQMLPNIAIFGFIGSCFGLIAGIMIDEQAELRNDIRLLNELLYRHIVKNGDKDKEGYSK